MQVVDAETCPDCPQTENAGSNPPGVLPAVRPRPARIVEPDAARIADGVYLNPDGHLVDANDNPARAFRPRDPLAAMPEPPYELEGLTLRAANGDFEYEPEVA